MQAMSKKQIIGFFDDEEKLLDAVRKIKENSLTIEEIYMPYPVHEALAAVGRKSRLGTAAYFLGVIGVISVLGFLYYTSVIDWPIDYGGKPFNSFPSFIVVTIVLTIFTITIGSLFLCSVRAKLFPGKKEKQVDLRISDDRFAMVMQADDDTTGKIHSIFTDCGVSEIQE
jgi:hypothetical protein